VRRLYAFRLYNGKKRTNKFQVKMGLYSTGIGREMTKEEINDFSLKYGIAVEFHDIIKDSKKARGKDERKNEKTRI
jgi:hypothetical protein